MSGEGKTGREPLPGLPQRSPEGEPLGKSGSSPLTSKALRNRKAARSYLRETQPETWRIAADMAELLAVRLAEKPWLERAYLFDSFVQDLAEEVLGGEGLDLLVGLPAQSLGGAGTLMDLSAQMIASVRSILSAAYYDLDPDDQEAWRAEPGQPEQALVLLFSELPEDLEFARAVAANLGPAKLAQSLLAFPGLLALLIADQAGSPTLDSLTTIEKLLELYAPSQGA